MDAAFEQQLHSLWLSCGAAFISCTINILSLLAAANVSSMLLVLLLVSSELP